MAHTLQISINFDKVPFWCEKNLPETKREREREKEVCCNEKKLAEVTEALV